MTDKTGNEIMDEAAADPTLDEMMRRDPTSLGDGARDHIIRVEWEQRAQFIKNEERKKDRKEGVNHEEEG